jgi:predicted metal-dependent peptidase
MTTNQKVNRTPVQKVADKLKEALKAAEKLEQRKPQLEKIARDKISYAKTRLMQLEPFFAMLLFKLPAVPCYQIPTMATEGTHILYNPVFVAEKILRKDVLFVLLHEIEHIFFKHHIRGPIKAADAQKLFDSYTKQQQQGVKDIFVEDRLNRIKAIHKKWNKATDYVINWNIKHDVKLPMSEKLEAGGLCLDEKFKNKTSEQVYKELDDEDDPNDGSPAGGIGECLPIGIGDLSAQEVAQIEKELENEVRAAAISAKKAGKLPKGVDGVIESLYTTKTPWQDVFRTIFTSISKQDYTFSRPNRRFTAHQMEYGVVLPSLWGEEYTNVGFIMDASGSVGTREKEILVSELKTILEDYPIELHVLYCDTQAYVDDVEVLTRDDVQNGRLKLNVKGGGGTDMRPGFDYFRNHPDNFEVIICLTDMHLFNWELGPEPEGSVYWAQLPNHNTTAKPPWGIKIDIVVNEEDRDD